MKTKIRINLKTKLTRVLVTGSIFASVAFAIVYLFFLSKPDIAKGAVAGDFRSKASGNWNNVNSWEKFDGSTWQQAVTTPTSSDNNITILNNHIITVTANVTVDELDLNANGQITINSGITLTVANGSGTDIIVSGRVVNSGTITINSGANGTVSSGGTYQHNANGGSIPLITWNTGSTCELTGLTNSFPSNLNQSFSNFIWNCTAQSTSLELGGALATINGDFYVISTGSGDIQINKTGSSTFTVGGNYYHQGGTLTITRHNAEISVGGNLNQSGGTVAGTDAASSGTGTYCPTITVNGDFILSGGTNNLNQYTGTSSGKGITTFNIKGNYTQTGGTLTETAPTGANYGYGNVFFTKLGSQTFSRTSGTISNNINFTVNAGSILDLGTSFPTGAGTFTVVASGALVLASPQGITSSGANGNVQVTGTRTYSSFANYTYNGTSEQVTGNGLPASVNNLICENNSNVTLTNSVSVNGILALNAGRIITNSNELNISNSSQSAISNHGVSNYVVGNLRRSILTTGTFSFPLGTLNNYELITVSLTGISGFSNILGTFSNENPLNPSYPLEDVLINNTQVTNILNCGFWNLTPNSPMTAGMYGVTLHARGHTYSAANPSDYCVLKRESYASYWQSIGDHNNSTQSENNGSAIASRTGLSSFSHFSVAYGNGTLPITLLSFTAKLKGNEQVELNWSTASEINNDYFTIEKSLDGINFQAINKIKGAGNSSATLNYSAIDTELSNNDMYYKLRQTDYDGKYSYSKIVLVKIKNTNKKEAGSISSIGPNPFTNNFNLRYQLDEPVTVEIELLNIDGKIIKKEIVNGIIGMNTYEFSDLYDLTPGIYFLNMKIKGQVISKKIIKK